MNYEERIINTILNTIKDNQVYLTQKENLPQLAKLGYMYNTLFYGGRTASYNEIISKIESVQNDGSIYKYPQCDENPKYKIEMCEPENETIENYIYDAWGMHVDNGYGPDWEEFSQIMKNGKELSEIQLKLLKPNKTFDEWVEILTDSDYGYSSIYPDRRSVADHLLCVIGNGYGFKNGFVISEAGGADQDTTDYGDWINAKFRDDIQLIVDTIMNDQEVELVLKHIGEEKAKLRKEKEEKEMGRMKEMSELLEITIEEYAEKFKSFSNKFRTKEEENPYEYYPISNYSIITKIDENSDPSYIKAGIEICEYILTNPPKHGKDFNQYQKDQCNNQIKFAQKFINKFKK